MYYKLIILLFVSLKMSGQQSLPLPTYHLKYHFGAELSKDGIPFSGDSLKVGDPIKWGPVDFPIIRDTTAAYILISDRTNKDYSNLIALSGYIVTIGERKIYLDYKKRQLPQRYIVWQTIKQ